MPKLYTALACYGIGFGIFSLPTALFIGPHMLAASIGHMLIGALNLWIAKGLSRQAAWAWWAGMAVSCATFLVFCTGLIASIQKQDTPGIAFYSLASFALLCVCVVTVYQRGTYVVRRQS